MIHGVRVKQLKPIPDERGRLMEVLRCDDEIFLKFGQAYITSVYPGAVKAWHYHRKQADYLAALTSMLKLVLYDTRADSPTRGEVQELHVGELNYVLVTIPLHVWNGFKGEGSTPALVANCATIAHDPTEIDRMDPFDNDIPYDWSLKHG